MKNIKIMWDYFKKEKAGYIIANIFVIIGDFHKMIPPIILGLILDNGFGKKDFASIPPLVIALILSTFIGSTCARYGVRKLIYHCERQMGNVRKDLFHKLTILDQTFYRRKTVGEILTIYGNDIDTVNHFFSFTVKDVTTIIGLFLGTLIYGFTVNGYVTIALLIPFPFIIILSLLFKIRTKNMYESLRNNLTTLNDCASNNIEGNRVVKAFTMEEYEKKQFQKNNKILRDKDIEINKINLNYRLLIDLLTNLMNILLILVGGYSVIKGTLTIGQLITFTTLRQNLSTPFLTLSGLMDYFQRLKISCNRIVELKQEKPKLKRNGPIKEKTILGNIEFQNVSFRYNSNTVLDDISFQIKPGQTIAFIGETGSGKTSIVNLLNRMIEPDSGKIILEGESLLDYDLGLLRKNIANVTQQPFLFSDSIKETIKFGNPSLTDEEMIEIADISCLDFVENLPEKFDTVIGEKGVNLSGGEKQRLSLARALSMKTNILILDDITSALDIETEKKIHHNLQKLNRNLTKIIIGEKIASVKEADQIYVVSKKQIIEHGTHEELLKKKGLYHEIYTIQTNNILESGGAL